MNDSVNAIVVRWKVALMQYDFDATHISGVKNIVTELPSRLVRNHLEEITPTGELEKLILSELHSNEILTDDVYNKIKEVHNCTAGHAGVERTIARLQAKGTAWLYMRTHVRYFIRQCACCQKMNAVKTPIQAHHFTVSSYQPMVKLNIDFIGPFNTEEESGYVLTVIDCFTRWVEPVPCEFANAEETANALLMHFRRYGEPSVLLSDRGSHFVNNVISEFLLHVGTEHSLTIAYSKQENSIVERANKEINRHLTAMFFDRRIVHL